MGEWVPSREAWRKFLLLLDADEEVAGEKYEVLRRKLVIYFECRKFQAADDMADETISRIIRRYDEGVHIEDVTRYAYGVAKIVALEGHAVIRREDSMRDELLRASNSLYVNKEENDEDRELRIRAFEACLEELSDVNREFILLYYKNTGREKIDDRRSLTEKLAVSRNAVTLRAFQLRKKIEKCVKARLKRTA